MLSWLNVFECSGSSHIHILSRVKLVVYQISPQNSSKNREVLVNTFEEWTRY